jgi:hypothetical protein
MALTSIYGRRSAFACRGEQPVSPATAAHDVPALARASIVLLLHCVVVLFVSIVALAPPAAAADQPTPDPSLDVRPDPAPAQPPAAPAKQRPTPVQKQAAPTAPTYVAPSGANATPQTTSRQSATPRSGRVSAHHPRTSAADRGNRSHERQRRARHASAIAALQRLSFPLATRRLLRPPAAPTSSSDDTGAQALLFAGLALLLFVAASGSLVRLTTRDIRREPGP